MGIPATQDKLLQLAVKRILEAIYEQDFLRCSYGYRPNVGALDAVDKLTIKLQFGEYHYVVEADIKGFFDTAALSRPSSPTCTCTMRSTCGFRKWLSRVAAVKRV